MNFKLIDSMKAAFHAEPPALVMEIKVKGGKTFHFALKCHPDFDRKRGIQAKNLIKQGLSILADHPTPQKH